MADRSERKVPDEGGSPDGGYKTTADENDWMNVRGGLPLFTASGWLDRDLNRLPWSHPYSMATRPSTARREVVLAAWDDLTIRQQREVIGWLL